MNRATRGAASLALLALLAVTALVGCARRDAAGNDLSRPAKMPAGMQQQYNQHARH